MNKKQDLRVVKTKKVLYETLILLMKNDTFEKIKVSDICQASLINRSTFYAHYNDKYELLVDLIDNLKENLINDLEANNQIVNSKEFYLEIIKLLMKHMEEKKDIYHSILISNRNSIVIDILLESVISDVNKRIKNETLINGVPNDVVSKFYLAAVVSIGIDWLTGKYSKEDAINYIDKLIPNTK